MQTVVAVLAAGEMGSSIAQRLIRHGARVLTSTVGRSAATVERAHHAGIEDASDEALASADFMLAIAPPKEAVAIARRMRGPLQRSAYKPVYIDCNAISDRTVGTIAEIVSTAGSRFVDGCIIGVPGRQEDVGPTLYLSGEAQSDVTTLVGLGVRTRSTGGPVGAASALKMVYAGLNKGLTGLAAAMAVAAGRAGAARALREELAYSQPQLLAHIGRTLPDMYRKAHRWEFEMHEVAAFAGDDAAVAHIFDAMAELFAKLALDWKSDRTAIGAIDAFLAARS